MMKYWKHAALALALVVGSASAMARQADMQDPERVQFVTQEQPMTLDQIRVKIVRAAQGLGWQAVKEEPGRIELLYDKGGKHQVYVEVLYDEKGYDINYLRSNNLNYSDQGGQRKIHPSYNRWVRNLSLQIGQV